MQIVLREADTSVGRFRQGFAGRLERTGRALIAFQKIEEAL
jgi:hypothetical protein